MAVRTVLIADRDPDAREILALALSRAGYRPVAVADGEAALAALAADVVKLVIAELYLPCAGERCLVRAIRQHSLRQDVPILVHSSRVTVADREWAERQGCTRFLAKPATIGELVEHVRALMRRTSARHRVRSES